MDLRLNTRASREAHTQVPPSSRGPQPRSTQLSPPLDLVRGERDPDEMNTKNTTSKILSPPSLTRAHYSTLNYTLSYLLLLLLSCTHPPPLLTQPPQGGWIRDTTEEGIEPNPGPSIISKNINGITHSADATFQKIQRAHIQKPILVIGLQEHNITEKHAHQIHVETLAYNRGLLYLQANRPAIETKGGTALIMPLDQIELGPGEKS